MKTKKEFIAAIRKAIKQRGDFTHNIITITLTMAAKELGYPVTNEIVKELDLARKFGIYPEESK